MNDLVKRLRNYNPPDRTIDEQRQIAQDILDAANYIEQTERELAAARKAGYAYRDQMREELCRAMKAEQENAALREFAEELWMDDVGDTQHFAAALKTVIVAAREGGK
jgi:hypothetical protein